MVAIDNTRGTHPLIFAGVVTFFCGEKKMKCRLAKEQNYVKGNDFHLLA
jgi:hypothetical protein